MSDAPVIAPVAPAPPVGPAAAIVPPSGLAGRPPGAVPLPPAADAAPAAPPADPVAAMVADSAVRQGGLAALLADLGAATASGDLPPAARAAAGALLAAHAPLDAGVTAQSLRAAVRGSGIFLEADLAAEAMGAPAPTVSGDLKAQLLRLAGGLAAASEAVAETTAEPGPPSTPSVYVQSLALAERPPPPVRGAAPRGQPPARPAPSVGAGGVRRVEAIRRDAEGALARLQLAQAASLPRPGAPAAWSLETPVATPQGSAVAQFEISREGGGAGEDASHPVWRARFALDLEPSGPVQAEVTLSQGRTRVTLWAERPGAQQGLADHQGELLQALGLGDGEDVAVRIVGGAPPRQAPAAGQLVDRRS